jgi:S-ribosylhomocysteine lyase LuxS involved in autoinducer biosynthesis
MFVVAKSLVRAIEEAALKATDHISAKLCKAHEYSFVCFLMLSPMGCPLQKMGQNDTVANLNPSNW